MSNQDKNPDPQTEANADEATDNVIPEEAVSENEDAAQAAEIYKWNNLRRASQ